MNPNQLALQNKAALEATGAFVVEPDGRVRMSADRGGGYAPPWVWAGAIPQASGNDPQSQALRIKLSTPASDPSSPWHSMYTDGGPFTKRSQWDSSNGTYEGGVDWGTLLGTAAVGSLFAAPAMASLFSAGGASGAGAGTGLAADGTLATTTIPTGIATLPAASAGVDVAGGIAPLASTTIPTGISTLPSAVPGLASTSPSSASTIGSVTAPLLSGNTGNVVKAITALASALGGRAIANASANSAVPPQLDDLLTMAVNRQKQLQPLGQAGSQGMYAMLPNFARVGTSMPNVPTDASGALQGAQKLFGG